MSSQSEIKYMQCQYVFTRGKDLGNRCDRTTEEILCSCCSKKKSASKYILNQNKDQGLKKILHF